MSGSYILPLLCFSRDLAENVQFLKLKSAHLCWAALPFFYVRSYYRATTLKTIKICILIEILYRERDLMGEKCVTSYTGRLGVVICNMTQT